MSDSTPELNKRERIWQVVAAIPAGKVCTYGEVARLAGLGRAARLVGHTLRSLPTGTKIPWHRVINSQGRLSLPAGSPGYAEQKARLREEGITFSGRDTISLRLFGWYDASP